MEEKKTIPVTPPVTAARRVFPVDGRDRAQLVLAWGVGVLCAEVLLWGLSGLGMTLLAAAWYGVLFWYGGAAPLARRENRLLLYAVGLLALTFALFADPTVGLAALNMLLVGLGQLGACTVCGLILYTALVKTGAATAVFGRYAVESR